MIVHHSLHIWDNSAIIRVDYMYNRDEAERVIVLSCLLYILTECAVMQSSDYEQVLLTEPRLKRLFRCLHWD